MFASLILEREPMQWADLPSAMASWLQTAGLVALVGLVFWCVQRFLTLGTKRPSRALLLVFLLCSVSIALDVIDFVFFFFWNRPALPGLPSISLWLSFGCIIPLVIVAGPVVVQVVRDLRWRRIWALARLSMKEAIRGRILWVFTIVAAVFLFAGYFIEYKPEDQIRNFVLIVFYTTAPLFLLLAALLGSFSIPTDVTRQTIHTIVTKPVQRFEIVLGRFLGYGILLSAALGVITALSLVYVARGVTEAARQESFKARVPVFGDSLTFWNTTKVERGDSVGREWDYRSYIRGRSIEGGAEAPKQYAIWAFDTVPAALADRTTPIPFEFTFDIFRMVKGKEGIFCTFLFTDGSLTVPDIEKALPKIRDARNKGVPEDKLIDMFGIFEASGIQVEDYHTYGLEVPVRLFQDIRAKQPRPLGTEKTPALKVLVSVGEDVASRHQMLGVAKRDLYLLDAELPFWQNFFKGAIGLWLSMLLVLGLAVACSTYLSGIISLLATLFLVGAGMMVDYVRSLAENKVAGGGPIESITRIVQGQSMGMPLEKSPTTDLAYLGDAVFRQLLGFVLRIIPDVTRYNLTDYVANGFDIPWGQVLFLDNLLPLVGYLLPWAVLAYYLINSREVANPT